jgi:hypothetical protein
MNIIKQLKEKVHSIIAKFIPACLPCAKKNSSAKADHKTVFDIEGVAGKSKACNIDVSPSKILKSFNTAMNLIFHLISCGYSFKCKLFSAGLHIPGKYTGTGEHLPEGVQPHVRIEASKHPTEYISKNGTVISDGIDGEDGAIDRVIICTLKANSPESRDIRPAFMTDTSSPYSTEPNSTLSLINFKSNRNTLFLQMCCHTLPDPVHVTGKVLYSSSVRFHTLNR